MATYEDYGDLGFEGSATTMEEPPAYKPVEAFDPRKDIDPLARKIFDDIGADRHLRHKDKMRLQSSYLAGIEDVQMQRAKLDDQRRTSMMDNLRIQQAEDSFKSIRLRQKAAAEAGQQRNNFEESVKSVMNGSIDPMEKRRLLDQLAIDNLSTISSDSTASNMLRMAKDTIQIPIEPSSLLTVAQTMEAIEKGVPADVISRGNPYEIAFSKRAAELEGKAKSQEAETVIEAQKEKRRLLTDLAKDGFGFMEKPGYEMYLKPEDHDRGRTLARIMLGEEGYAEFDKLSDVDKKDALQEMRVKALIGVVEDADKPRITDVDAKVNAAFAE